jgi:DNA (cytosine-5)-methyltransferase 1
VNVGSLFAGIGGFDLGLERAGLCIAWQVELDPYCQAVLARRFPRARRFPDIREVGAGILPPVDLLCGGFPCQDLSVAGKGAGIDGARSGLWSEFARIVRELRPRYVLVENVPALLSGKGRRWDRAPVGRVLGDLAALGYDAEWACLSAREFGAPHLRKRVWIVAYPDGGGREAEVGDLCEGQPDASGCGPELADPARDAEAWSEAAPGAERQRARPGGSEGGGRALAHSDRDRRDEGICVGAGHTSGKGDALGLGPRERGQGRASHAWTTEPDVGRVAHGVPDRVERLAALGNALVPQIAEWIGRRIIEYEARPMTAGATGRPPGVGVDD